MNFYLIICMILLPFVVYLVTAFNYSHFISWRKGSKWQFFFRKAFYRAAIYQAVYYSCRLFASRSKKLSACLERTKEPFDPEDADEDYLRYFSRSNSLFRDKWLYQTVVYFQSLPREKERLPASKPYGLLAHCIAAYMGEPEMKPFWYAKYQNGYPDLEGQQVATWADSFRKKAEEAANYKAMQRYAHNPEAHDESASRPVDYDVHRFHK